ncbi:hypothetical protein ACFFQW_20185 [Umezawaea endophytica]|uniref:Uncharacterized protein n=1 Tax=Umezawaea endophytica TaxID=1654476 RepID=A0A9X2VTH7_9PSEU|nr:hypothetical protein [Umezawaea endophytica]MCS7482366.1 hypothetical protein [Umezawaea endophytica]
MIDSPGRFSPTEVAHVDETSVHLGNNISMYGIAAVLTCTDTHPIIADALTSTLLPTRTYLHHYDETSDRRLMIAKIISELPLDGALIVMETTTAQRQERARTRLLSQLLPRLQHEQHVRHVVLESRSGSDRHDRRTLDRLRRSRVVSAELRMDHVKKGESALVWLPDFVAGAYFAARYHDQPEPWELITTAHAVDVLTFP